MFSQTPPETSVAILDGLASGSGPFCFVGAESIRHERRADPVGTDETAEPRTGNVVNVLGGEDLAVSSPFA
jgi:hypothetical protein